jgi:putative ABC transport system substrate-binding protein
VAYGADSLETCFLVRGPYVVRVLRGEGEAKHLPIQVPVKFELVINLKTAKALGLTVPQNQLVSADQLIE